jgi:VWFA-related protein
LIAAVVATLLAPAAQAPPVFQAEVGVVRVEVSVTKGGVPVRGLRASDFELRDNGRRQEAELVLEEQPPVDAVLVLDTSLSVRGPTFEALKEAARTFLAGLREGEEAAVLAFREEVKLLEAFTSDRDRIHRTLDRAEPRGSTALHDAVYAALRLRAPGARRTAVVVFSDGNDSMSWLTAEEVVEAAARSHALVYGVAMREGDERKEPFLREVVRASGGRLFEAASAPELRERFASVLADIRSRYVLSFTPEGDDTTGWHALEVKLKRAGGDVLARPGYWRGSSAP